MNHQNFYYAKVKQILESPQPNINSFNVFYPCNTEDLYFRQFLVGTLSKYISSYKVCESIRTKFVKNASENNITTMQLLSTITTLTQNNQITDNLRYFLQIERETNALKTSLEKSEIQIANCKFFTFKEYDRQLHIMINRIVQALNIYQSFLIICTSKQKQELFTEEKLQALNYYNNNYYYLPTKRREELSILQEYKKQSRKIDQIIDHSSKYYPTINYQSNRSMKLDQINKLLVRHDSQINQIQLMIKNTIKNLQQDRQLNPHQIFFPRNNTETIQLLTSLIVLIKKVTLQRNKQIIGDQLSFPSSNSLAYKCISPIWGLQHRFYQTQSVNLYQIKPKLRQITFQQNDSQLLKAKNISLQDLNQKNNNFIESVTTIFDQYQQKINSQSSILAFDQNLQRRLQQFKQLLHQWINRNPSIIHDVPQKQSFLMIQKRQDQRQITYLFPQKKVFMDLTEQRNFSGYGKKSQIYRNQSENQLSELPSSLSQNNSMDRSLDIKRQLQKNNQSLKKKQSYIKQLLEKIKHQQQTINQLKKVTSQSHSYLPIYFKEKKEKNQMDFETITDIKMSDIQFLFQNYQNIKNKLALSQQQLQRCRGQNQKSFQERCELRNRCQIQRQKRLFDLKQKEEKHQMKILQIKQKMNKQQQKKITQINNKYNKILDQLNKKHQNLTSLYYQLQIKYKQQLDQRYNKSMSFISEINKSIINSSQALNNEIQHQNQIKRVNNNNHQIQQLNRLHSQRKNQFQLEIMQLKSNNSNLNSEILSLLSQKDDLKDQIKNKQEKYQSLIRNCQNLQLKIQQYIKSKEEQSNTISSLQRTISELQKSIARLSVSLVQNNEEDQSNQQNQVHSNLARFVYYTKPLFNQDIFLQDERSKKILVSHIQGYTRSRITRTALLHKYDTRNKANFHQYIDNIKGLAIVVKTRSAIFAGYYPSIFKDKQILDKGGLLISVTNDDSFFLHKKKHGDQSKLIYRGMIYDTYFALFGNAEIRVKTGIKTVFSNFGVSNGYFDSRGHRIDRLFNQGQTRQMPFQYCEFYQVFLERQNQIY